MPAGTSSKKRTIMDSDEEGVSAPQAGPSTSKRPRWSPEEEGPQPPDKGKGKEKAPQPHASSSKPRSASKSHSDARATRRRKTPKTVVTVTPSTSNGESPADSVPTLVPSDQEADESGAGPSGSRVEAAAEPKPQPPTEEQDELSRLRKELAAKNALIQKQEDAFSSLQATLQCQICLEIMWDPYITNCGHTACLSCLQSWFKAPPPDLGPNDAPPLAPHLRRKTCPMCRATIRTRPTPAFIAKSIVGIAKPFFDPAALASENEARPVPIVPGGQPPDPWAGIFVPPHRAGEGGRHRHHDEDVIGVIEDEEDGVLRCVDCLYEIMNGVCAGCGRVFNELQDDGGYTDEGDDLEEDHPFPFFDLGVNPMFQAMQWQHGAFHDPWEDEEDEVDSDESDDGGEGNEMHGFIVSDDQEDEPDDVEADSDHGHDEEEHERPNTRSRNPELIELGDSEDSEDEWVPPRGSRRYAHLRDNHAHNSEDERRLRSEQALERERFMFGNGEYMERDRPRAGGSSRTRNRFVVQSDDEDEDEDDPRRDWEDAPGEGSMDGTPGDSVREDHDGEQRGWIGDHELYDSQSDRDDDEEEDVERHYIDHDAGRDYSDYDDHDDYPDERDWEQDDHGRYEWGY